MWSGGGLFALALLVLVAGCSDGSSSSPPPTAVVPTSSPTAADTAAIQTPTKTPPPPTLTATIAAPTETPTVDSGWTSTPTSTPAIATATSTPGGPSPTETLPRDTPTPTVPRRTSTPTPTFDSEFPGPIVTFLGIVRPDGCRVGCFNSVCFCPVAPTPIIDEMDREIHLAQGGGRGLLVVEARPGGSGLPVASELTPFSSDERPDLQIIADRALGNGSTLVCDKGQPPPIGMGGGVPAIDPPDFGPGQDITDAMSDLACRFAVQPSNDDACTLDNFGNFHFLGQGTTIQFCDQVATVSAFPSGDTILSVRVRDVGGNLGPLASIIVRNLAAQPTPTDGE